MEAPLWTISCKIKANVFPDGLPFQFKYMRIELQAIGMG